MLVTSGGYRPVGSGYSPALDLPPGHQPRPRRPMRRRSLPPPLGQPTREEGGVAAAAVAAAAEWGSLPAYVSVIR